MSSLAFWLIVAILAFFFGGMIGALVVCLLAILIGDGTAKTVFTIFAIIIGIMLVMGRL